VLTRLGCLYRCACVRQRRIQFRLYAKPLNSELNFTFSVREDAFATVVASPGDVEPLVTASQLDGAWLQIVRMSFAFCPVLTRRNIV